MASGPTGIGREISVDASIWLAEAATALEGVGSAVAIEEGGVIGAVLKAGISVDGSVTGSVTISLNSISFSNA